MTEQNARIRINLSTLELEVEGTEAFVSSHAEKIEEFLELLKKRSNETPVALPTTNGSLEENEVQEQEEEVVQQKSALGPVPETFGEFYLRAAKNINDIDKVLLGGYFIQHKNDKNIFSTREVSAVLKENGIYLKNPSHSIKLNLDARRIFAVKKGCFRVSEDGLERLSSVVR
jgi:hypothetical protein